MDLMYQMINSLTRVLATGSVPFSTMTSPLMLIVIFFSSRRRHTRCSRDWSSDVCSSDLCPNDLWAGSPKVKPLRGPHPEVGRLRRNPPKPSRENKPRGRRNSRRLRRGGCSNGDRTIQGTARRSRCTGASGKRPDDAGGSRLRGKLGGNQL